MKLSQSAFLADENIQTVIVVENGIIVIAQRKENMVTVRVRR